MLLADLIERGSEQIDENHDHYIRRSPFTEKLCGCALGMALVGAIGEAAGGFTGKWEIYDILSKFGVDSSHSVTCPMCSGICTGGVLQLVDHMHSSHRFPARTIIAYLRLTFLDEQSNPEPQETKLPIEQVPAEADPVPEREPEPVEQEAVLV